MAETPLSRTEERELLDLCFTGDKSAWDKFIECYSKLVYYTIYQTFKISGANPARDEVEDIYSGVFLALFENNYAKLKSFKGKNACSLASWLKIITSRKTYNHLRKKSKESRIFETNVENFNDPRHKAMGNIEAETLLVEQNELLQQAILQLKPDEIAFLTLCYEKELPAEKVAQIQGLTVSAVHSKKYRIHQKLKKIIEKQKKY